MGITKTAVEVVWLGSDRLSRCFWALYRAAGVDRLRSMVRWLSKQVSSDPMDILWHYLQGEMPDHLTPDGPEIGWVKYSHRGVQYLDQIRFPRKQQRYVFNPRHEVRYNQAFEEVIRHCARRPRTWLTPSLIEGCIQLHRMGYAHSYEAWEDGRLVGGGFGIQIGGYITCESLFHLVSNAGKAAWGQTLLRLRDRGFRWVDTNCVAKHQVQYGEQWVPQWKFEQMLREAVWQKCSLADEFPCPPVPLQIRLGLPVARVAGALVRRLRSRPAAASA